MNNKSIAVSFALVLLFQAPPTKAAPQSPILQRPIGVNVGTARGFVYAVYSTMPSGFSGTDSYVAQVRSAIYAAVESKVKVPGQVTFEARMAPAGGECVLVGAVQPGAKPVDSSRKVVIDSSPSTLAAFREQAAQAVSSALTTMQLKMPPVRTRGFSMMCTVAVDGVFSPRHNTETYSGIAVFEGDTATFFGSPDGNPFGSFKSENHGNACNYVIVDSAYISALNAARANVQPLKMRQIFSVTQSTPTLNPQSGTRMEFRLGPQDAVTAARMRRLQELGRNKEAAQVMLDSLKARMPKKSGFAASAATKDALMKKADSAIAAKKYPEAVAALLDAEKHSSVLDYQDPVARILLMNKLVDCQYKASDLPGAAETYGRIVAVMEENAMPADVLKPTRQRYAQLLRKLGRTDEAEDVETFL